MVGVLARDLLHPSLAEEKRKCKLKRLVPSPNSYFMDVKCADCLKIQVVFSHAQTPVVCPGCDRILCTPTGGKAKLTYGRVDKCMIARVYNLHSKQESATWIIWLLLWGAKWSLEVGELQFRRLCGIVFYFTRE
ncbi:40S ribosomal protein S27 [Echinococcus granulosus]|uniref:40S ribosomal protein S27 n=1 Tax=Echinococcus granulosus TaxID=6210 RepID=W6UMP6_ECHGR|nr:40S ribosomal protein S27 [Echinococcus granulosus]EUB62328.1 40S ribosomal protein S27 [Echinococcus granulosus]